LAARQVSRRASPAGDRCFPLGLPRGMFGLSKVSVPCPSRTSQERESSPRLWEVWAGAGGCRAAVQADVGWRTRGSSPSRAGAVQGGSGQPTARPPYQPGVAVHVRRQPTVRPPWRPSGRSPGSCGQARHFPQPSLSVAAKRVGDTPPRPQLEGPSSWSRPVTGSLPAPPPQELRRARRPVLNFFGPSGLEPRFPIGSRRSISPDRETAQEGASRISQVVSWH